VAWAPHLGQPVHKIATAGKDKTVRIWEVRILKSAQKIEVRELAKFEEHNAEVWRVEWNATGTILASTGDDGIVRFWKANMAGEWKRLLDVKPDPSQNVSAQVQPFGLQSSATATTTASTTTSTTSTIPGGSYWPAGTSGNQYFTQIQKPVVPVNVTTTPQMPNPALQGSGLPPSYSPAGRKFTFNH